MQVPPRPTSKKALYDHGCGNNILLLRIGDTNFYADQLQVDGSGVSLGKFPEKNKGKLLSLEEWYHVAFTYDLETGIACIYVNGQLQSQTQVAPTVKVINLGLRAIDPDPETDARQFFIGYSYDAFRQLCGDISEVRIWSVARTQADIWRDMYDVENPAEYFPNYALIGNSTRVGKHHQKTGRSTETMP